MSVPAADCTGSWPRLASEGRFPGLRSAMTPNPSLEPTRYGRRCKLGHSYGVHFLCPSLQRLPPRSSQLER
jgi:hypothetical protein